MPTDAQNTPHHAPALEFKSSTFSVPVLVLSSDDFVTIGQQLQKKIQLAPDFFKNSPVVFDVQWLNKHNLAIDITTLVAIIHKAGLLPIGIRGGNDLQNKQALALRIPIYSIHNSLSAEPKKAEAAPQAVAAPNTPTTLINHPVRSGQRLYADGDLIILAQVSAGAEIMAEGNIHVYGSLRGRALAGVQGDTSARIFCFDLGAELLSIAGNYKISEDMRGVARNKPVQVYLQEHALIIKELT
ncbi:MAG: septum site-determining protein MinC [Methylovulum sp.]|nr:septum site-determining protein MinC [Methylovulum sp.]